MLLETIVAPFVKERPIGVMARAVLERLLDAPRLDALLARTAQQPYTRELLLSSLVQLMSAVVLGGPPTVHAAYQANKEALGVSTTALYTKLDRVEIGGPGPATYVEHRWLSARGWPCPGTPLACRGTPTRPSR